MIAHVLTALALNEVRLRMRRRSTMVALLVVVILSWAMIVDPASGNAMMVIDHARVLYTSSAIAIAGATFAAMLFGLGGFYLVRGRITEDIRSGTGSVIGATPVGNALFLTGRWLGGVAYLGALIGACMGTLLVLHVVRGDGPIEILIYLQSFALLLLPQLFFTVSCAILFDSWTPLMGKTGDVLYFVIWMAQAGIMGYTMGAGAGATPLLVVDFSGMSVAALILSALEVDNLSTGGRLFDPALAPLTLTSAIWNWTLIGARCATAVLALLPMLPAVALFHRFSPDKVKLASSRQRRSPLALVNGWLRPLSALVRPLFRLAALLPGMTGQVLGDVALTLASAPLALLVLLLASAAALLVDAPALAPLLGAVVAFWGILISDISTRDDAAGTEQMTAAVHGGAPQRYLRQYAASVLLGLMFMGVVALRWSFSEPLRALALVVGILGLSALASLLGQLSRNARLFLSLFLFWLYIASSVRVEALIDAVGFNGVANTQSVLMHAMGALLALSAGYNASCWSRYSR